MDSSVYKSKLFSVWITCLHNVNLQVTAAKIFAEFLHSNMMFWFLSFEVFNNFHLQFFNYIVNIKVSPLGVSILFDLSTAVSMVPGVIADT